MVSMLFFWQFTNDQITISIQIGLGCQSEHCMNELVYTCDWWLLVLCTLEMFLHQFRCDTDDMLAFPVLDHVEGLQRADDVTLGDAGHLAVRGDFHFRGIN